MKIVCVKHSSDDRNFPEEIPARMSYGFMYGGLTIGREYFVMGIFYKSVSEIYYLIDYAGIPFWYAHTEFEIVENKVPAQWYIKIMGPEKNMQVSVLMSFDELCNQDTFQELLADGDENALRIYRARKEELENGNRYNGYERYTEYFKHIAGTNKKIK